MSIPSLISNIIEDTDSYKLHHFEMYPTGTERVYSYFECRTGAVYPEVKMFGLQPLLHELAKPITKSEVLDAFELSKEHGLPLNFSGWEVGTISCDDSIDTDDEDDDIE